MARTIEKKKETSTSNKADSSTEKKSEKMETDTSTSSGSTVAKKSQQEIDALSIEDIREHFVLIERSVNIREHRHTLRVLRLLPSTRRKLNDNVMYHLIKMFFNGRQANDDVKRKEFLSKLELSWSKDSRPSSRQSKMPRIPETEAYLYLLVLIFLIDTESYKLALHFANKVASFLVNENRRSLDPIAGKCYFYYSRIYELNEQLDAIRSVLHARLRTAVLVHDVATQAVLLNCLLRNYLYYNLYDQAEKLAAKSTFPEQASNNEWARYLYYTGRIKAVQLDYSEARRTLITALRKAPQSAALGFKQTVSKLTIVVELLLGEIPERAQFMQKDMQRSLLPYFHLTQAVRIGDLGAFTDTLEKYAECFQKDRNYKLILRVRHNVIKAGVRRISSAYSRVFLSDVADKLQLDSAEDAEFIVAKAIRDGVIEAEINHGEGFVKTKDVTDVYSTREPLKAFHSRISFCLDTYRHSVMAMRFPPKSYHVDLESAEERREREQQDLEFAKEMADEEDEFP